MQGPGDFGSEPVPGINRSQDQSNVLIQPRVTHLKESGRSAYTPPATTHRSGRGRRGGDRSATGLKRRPLPLNSADGTGGARIRQRSVHDQKPLPHRQQRVVMAQASNHGWVVRAPLNHVDHPDHRAGRLRHDDSIRTDPTAVNLPILRRPTRLTCRHFRSRQLSSSEDSATNRSPPTAGLGAAVTPVRPPAPHRGQS
ncbi:MAG: hypothetical protein QOE61_528, partial [Micromonosporaceae bacterium]|nr:hypothetical protein [Micromonosporaceae bacterium]